MFAGDATDEVEVLSQLADQWIDLAKRERRRLVVSETRLHGAIRESAGVERDLRGSLDGGGAVLLRETA